MYFELFSLLLGLAFVIFIFRKVSPGRGVKQMLPSQLQDQYHIQETQFIDVRKPDKFARYAIPRFKNIPLNEIRKRSQELDPQKPTVVMCQTGMTSIEACKRLKRRGFTDLYHIRGGLSTVDPESMRYR